MKYIIEHKPGFIGTFITHAVIIFFLVYFGLLITPPVPKDEGILVNFGDSETGLGIEEPAPGERTPSKIPVESTSEKKVVPVASKKNSTSAEEDPVLTQDEEKTIAIKSPSKRKIVPKEIDPEKLRQEESERLRKAETARQKREAEEQLAQAAAEQRKIGVINNRAKSAFGGGGKSDADSRSTSQGVTYGSGNQGTANGVANAEKYGPGGGTGNGVSFNLDGRTAQSLPKPSYPGNDEAVVVVQVTVDKSGRVTKADPGMKGSNTANPELLSAAKKAALEARFNVDGTAPSFQIGSITYRFVLN